MDLQGCFFDLQVCLSWVYGFLPMDCLVDLQRCLIDLQDYLMIYEAYPWFRLLHFLRLLV